MELHSCITPDPAAFIGGRRIGETLEKSRGVTKEGMDIEDNRTFLRFNLSNKVMPFPDRHNPLFRFEYEILAPIKRAEVCYFAEKVLEVGRKSVWTYDVERQELSLYLDKDFFDYLRHHYTGNSRFRLFKGAEQAKIREVCLDLETRIVEMGEAQNLLPDRTLESIQKSSVDPGGVRILYRPQIYIGEIELFGFILLPWIFFTSVPFMTVKRKTYYWLMAGLVAVFGGLGLYSWLGI